MDFMEGTLYPTPVVPEIITSPVSSIPLIHINDFDFWSNSYENNTLPNLYENITTDIQKEVRKSLTSGPTMLMRFVCEVCIVIPIALLGVICNILAVIVLHKQKQRQGTNLFLQVLAAADTSILLTSVLLRSLRYLYYYTKWAWLYPYMSFYPYIFVWLYPLVYFFRLIDTWLIVLLTVDRYIAVRYPLHAQRLCTLPRAVKNLISLIIISFLFSLPRFFEHRIDTDNKDFGFSGTELIRNNRAYLIGYRIVVFFVFQYLLPIVLLIFLNTQLLRTLRNADVWRAQISQEGEGQTAKSRSITGMVVTVVLVAILCNMTALVVQLFWSLQQGYNHLNHFDEFRRYLALISNIFVTINSAVNFGIYCLCSRNFRTVLCRICRCYRKKRLMSRTQSSTRTTGIYISLTHSSTIRKKPSLQNANGSLNMHNKLYG